MKVTHDIVPGHILGQVPPGPDNLLSDTTETSTVSLQYARQWSDQTRSSHIYVYESECIIDDCLLVAPVDQMILEIFIHFQLIKLIS